MDLSGFFDAELDAHAAVLACADPLLIVPSPVTARIQEMHILLGQMLCAAPEREFGLV